MKTALSIIFVFGIGVLLFLLIKGEGLGFALGAVFAILVYQFGYYATHGKWIEF